jgi:hypothetical protein
VGRPLENPEIVDKHHSGDVVIAALFASKRELDGEMALRFDVYCREMDPMGFLDRRETDVDDAWAHRSGARLVLCAARRRG